MSSNKYIPPNKRNTDTNSTMNSTHQQQNRRPYRKPQWEIAEEERLMKEQLRVSMEEGKRKNVELTENNFPALGTPAVKASVWGGSKTFAALAVEWDEKVKKEELENKEQEKEEPANVFRRRNAVPLPQFHNVHRFVEPEDDESEEQASKPTPVEDDGWVTVDRRKYRRQKTIEEKLARPPTPENDDSVWNDNAQDEHDTCWDENN
jgi:hypothetical protein